MALNMIEGGGGAMIQKSYTRNLPSYIDLDFVRFSGPKMFHLSGPLLNLFSFSKLCAPHEVFLATSLL